MARKGLFITLEGGEGSGKTTQIARLKAAVEAAGHEAVTTREPGGTPDAEKIRALLVDRDGGAWTPMAEIMLLYAARIMHVDGLIRPALREGKIVLCDRFSDSTRAYQRYGHGMDMETIDRVDALSLGGFRPDLTFILDVPPREGLARAGRRQGREDRFERLDIGFHERLRAGYLEIAAREPQRCVVVDAAADADAVFAALSAHVMDRLQKTAPGEKHVRGI